MAGVLDTQGERIRALEAYLQKQEAAFVALLDQQQQQPSTPTKQAASAASSSSNPSPTATHPAASGRCIIALHAVHSFIRLAVAARG